MKVQFDILRQKNGAPGPYRQSFLYETDDETETVAAALTKLNARPVLKDTDGNPAQPVRWDCNCLQKKCGACAMVINGRPQLACDSTLKNCGPKISLAPLRKFPVVEDLVTDRSILQDNLREMQLWFSNEAAPTQSNMPVAYEASRCLQCGCCLEVCPNFYAGGAFTGMAAAVPMTRILTELPKEERKELSKLYRHRVFEGCGKSLACRDICPAKIDIEKMLVNSNAIAVWKRLNRKWKE